MGNDIIFDFDGVIANTREILFAIFKEFHPAISDEDFQGHFDGNVYDDPRIKFTLQQAERLHAAYRDRINVGHVQAAFDPLKRLYKNHRLFIISSGDERGITGVLADAGLKDHFQAIYGHNTHRSKIAKFEMLKDRFSLALEDAVFVTDTLGDVREAGHLGIRTIAETFGFHNRARLAQGSPSAIVDTWGEIEAEIKASR